MTTPASQISPGVRRFAAVGIAAALVLFLVTTVVLPAWNRLFEAAAALQDARFELTRARALLAGAGRYDRQLVDAKLSDLHALSLGDDEAGATARLEQHVRQLLAAPGVTIGKLEALPPVQRERATDIRVHVVASGPERAWLPVLAALERTAPLLSAEAFRISRAGDTPDHPLQVEMTLSGFVPKKARR